MKWFRFAFSSVVIVVLLAGSLPASAVSSSAFCFGSWRVGFVPGLGTTSQTVEYKTEGGSIQCVGAVEGSAVTGPGTLAQQGQIEGSALGGTGFGTTILSVPTSAGPKSVSFDDTFSYGPGIGFKQSDFLVGPWTFTFVPTSGDGIITPVTEILVVGAFTLKSDPNSTAVSARCDLDAIVIKVNCHTSG